MRFLKTRRQQKAGYQTVASIVANLSAAWFAAAYIAFSQRNFFVLTSNLLFGILSMVISYLFQVKSNDKS